MPRRRRQPSEQLLVTLLVAAFVIACVGLVGLVAYRLLEQAGRALGQ